MGTDAAIIETKIQCHASETLAESQPSKSRVMSFEKPDSVARLLLDFATRSADIDVEPRPRALDGRTGNMRLAFTMNDDRPKS